MDDIVYPEFSSFYTDDNAFEDKITCHISKWGCIPGQGRTVKLKRGGRILRKINCFCEILKTMSQKGGGDEGPSPPPTLYAYEQKDRWLNSKID